MQKFLIVTLMACCLSLGFSIADAQETPADRVEQIKGKIGMIVTELALATSIDEAGLDSLRKRLAALYHELEQLGEDLADEPVPTVEEMPEAAEPTYSPGPWAAYTDASVKIFPAETEFRGWSMDANMTVNLGDGGEIILRVENSYYLAEWEIHNGYNSHGQASVSATAEGEVLVNVEDASGRHEFMIEQGGVGSIHLRGYLLDAPPKQVSPIPAPAPESVPVVDPAPLPEPEPVPTVEPEPEPVEPSAQPVGDEDWYTRYLDLVRNGKLDSSPAMMWFIHQAQTHSYETDALRDLGEALNRMGGGQGSLEPIGTMVYYVDEQRKELSVPDPRVSPGAFTGIVNRAYILTQDSEVYTIEMN